MDDNKSKIWGIVKGFILYFCIPYITVFWLWYKKKWTKGKRIAFSAWALAALILVISDQASSAAELKESQANYQKAVVAAQNKKWDDALQYYKKVIGRDSEYSDAQKQTEKITDIMGSEQHFKYGVKLLDQKSYDSAEHEFSAVINDDSNYSEAQSDISKIHDIKVGNLIAVAKVKMGNSDFDGAQSDLQSALAINANAQEAKDLLAQDQAKLAEKKRQEEAQKQREEAQRKQQEIVDYKAGCQTYEYRVLNKNPDSLAGNQIKARGQVLQIQEDSGVTVMRVAITKGSFDIWDDAVMIVYAGKIDVYEKDLVTVWGEIEGSYTYKSVAGWDVTVPKITAKYAEKGLK